MRLRLQPYIVGVLVGFVLSSVLRWSGAFDDASTAAKVVPEPDNEAVTRADRLVVVVTPTYARPQQKAELTRLSYALRLAGRIHWVVVEDAPARSELVTRLLASSRLPYSQLTAATPPQYKLKAKNPNWLKPRGVLQRNEALRYLRSADLAAILGGDDDDDDAEDAVVYFADDDNTYDVRLFDEMRLTKKVSVWPVGLVGGLMVERPIVVDGRVKRFNSVFRPDRPFPIDMAAFAISLKVIRAFPAATFSLNVQRGYQESHLLAQLIAGWHELEPRADNCTKVLVWHTRTEAPNLKLESKLSNGYSSNKDIEV